MNVSARLHSSKLKTFKYILSLKKSYSTEQWWRNIWSPRHRARQSPSRVGGCRGSALEPVHQCPHEKPHKQHSTCILLTPQTYWWWFGCWVMSDSCDPMGCSLPGSSVHGILQARILEWVAISFSWGSSRPGNQTRVSCIVGRFFTNWPKREAEHTSHCFKMFILLLLHF